MLSPRVTETIRAGKKPAQRELVTASLVAVAPKDRTNEDRRPTSRR